VDNSDQPSLKKIGGKKRKKKKKKERERERERNPS